MPKIQRWANISRHPKEEKRSLERIQRWDKNTNDEPMLRVPKEQALSLDRIQDGPCCVKLPNNFYMNVFEISNQNNKMNSGSKMPIHYLTTRKKDKDRHQLIKLHLR